MKSPDDVWMKPSKGPVCNCGECYREWAKEEIERLKTNEQLLQDYRAYAGFLRSVIRSGEKLSDDYDFQTFQQYKREKLIISHMIETIEKELDEQ